jgi:transcription elongation factor Elf1
MKAKIFEKRTVIVWDVECPKCGENNEYYPEVYEFVTDKTMECWNCPTRFSVDVE